MASERVQDGSTRAGVPPFFEGVAKCSEASLRAGPPMREELAQLGFVEHQLTAVPGGDVAEADQIGCNTMGRSAMHLTSIASWANRISRVNCALYVGMTSL